MSDLQKSELDALRQGRIFVAGHRGMVGSAIVRRLQAAGCENLILRQRSELDLTDQRAVARFFENDKPDYVFMAAARVGGINANNSYPADFIYDNLMIAANVTHAAYSSGIRRMLFLGSSCIYPRLAGQPMSESELLTGTLEPTNEPYAVAKIAGIKLCESYNRQHATDFRSAMPTNLYGPNDNFDLETSHVLPALLRKFHEARANGRGEVEVWGTGRPRREFLHVDDLADASVFLMCMPKEDYDGCVEPMLSHVNVGTGEDIAIGELAGLIAEVTGFRGEIVFNSDQPDGTPRKLLDVGLLSRLGWQASISLEDGLRSTYDWYRQNIDASGR